MENLNVNQVHVLAALLDGEKFGLQIVKTINESGGNIVLGSIYNLLMALERKDFIRGFYKESTESRKGNKRRYYEITASGRQALIDIKSSFNMAFKLI